MSLPTSWQATKLGDVLLSIVGGGTPSKSNVRYYKGNIPWMSVKDMKGNILNETVDHITEEAVRNSSTNIIPAGTPIIATRMSLGKIVVANFDSAINQDLKALFPASGVNYNYLINWYRSIAWEIEELGTGTTVKGIRLDALRSLEFLLPPLSEQKVIVDKLDNLLTQVETIKARLERVHDFIKCFRQSVLTAAVSGKLTKDWRSAAQAQWKESKLLDVIQEKPRNGYSPKGVSYETPYRNLTLSATTSGQFVENHFKYIELDIDSNSYLWVKYGDILIQRANSIDYVGVSAIYEGEDNQYVYPDLMMKCRPNTKKVLGRYLHLALSSQKVRQYFRDNATGTSGNMPKINQQVVSNAPISLPPLDEQREIVRRVEAFFTFADHINQQVNSALARVNNLTQSILAKAFRGELTADWRAANPELISGNNSAKALLEKIKLEREVIERQPKPKRSVIKKNAGGCMSKQIIKVVEALKQAGESLNGQQLLAAAGYPIDSSTEQLEQFFLDIREALTIEESIVKLERGDDSQDWFALANPLANKAKS